MDAHQIIKSLRQESGMTRKEFADYYGIPVRTLEDWEYARRTPPEYLIKLLSYKVKLDNIDKETINSEKENANIITDADGHKIIVINDIKFKGKRKINWSEVKEYLKGYVGKHYSILMDNEIIYIGNDLPDEYTGSKYTYTLKGTNAKAKANATQELPQIIEIATNPVFMKNKKEKHIQDAANGWYRYESRFALPVYDRNNEIERYNIFHVFLVIRHDKSGKKYLYDIIDVRKEK